MSGSVRACLECGAPNWITAKKCEICGGELGLSLREVYGLLYLTDPDFRRNVEEQKEKDKHCPKCQGLIDREGFLRENGYKRSGEYKCPACGHVIITIKIGDEFSPTSIHKTEVH